MREPDDALSNHSENPTFESVLVTRYSRRQVLTGGLVAAGAALLGRGGLSPPTARAAEGLLGFRGVPVSRADTVVVPPGYTAEVLYKFVSAGPRSAPDRTEPGGRAPRPW